MKSNYNSKLLKLKFQNINKICNSNSQVNYVKI